MFFHIDQLFLSYILNKHRYFTHIVKDHQINKLLKMEGDSSQEPKAADVSQQIGVSKNGDASIDNTHNVKSRKHDIAYANVIFLIYAHIAAIHGIYFCLTSTATATILFNVFVAFLAIEGVTAGAHRLWSHKCYKAKMPLQILLMLCHCIASQQSIIMWVKNHRLHHKYSDTNADPHNINRGFFFSHMGWLMVRKHKDVIEKGKNIDLSDVYSNPVLRFQKKYVAPLITLLCFVIPTVIPMYCFEEKFINAWHLTMIRFCYVTNVTLFINSIGHRWGYRPYDKEIAPAQHTLLTVATLGEGYHNYHHVFPYDYRASEWGNNAFNLTTLFIEFFEKLGWAYDLKSPQPEMVSVRAKRTGDGSNSWSSGRVSLFEYY